MKIENVSVEEHGFFDFRRVEIDRWGEIQKDLLTKNVETPPASDLHLFGDVDQLHVMLSTLTITVVWKNSKWIQYRFYPGFITDLASVPKFVRSLIDNDDLDLLAAALIHDANFSCHFLTFRETNALFRSMVASRGAVGKAWLAWLAVSSPVGRVLWRKNQKRRGAWTGKTVTVLKSR